MKLSGRKIRRILIWSLVAFNLVLCAGCGLTGLVLQRNLKQGGYTESWSADDGRVLSGLSYGKEKANSIMMYVSVLLSILLTVGVFIVLPTWIIR